MSFSGAAARVIDGIAPVFIEAGKKVIDPVRRLPLAGPGNL